MRHSIVSALVAIAMSLYVQPVAQSDVHDIKIKAVSVDEALRRLAMTYKTVIGLERSGSTTFNQRVSVTLVNATLPRALDAVTKSAGHGYSWKQESDNVFHVFTAGADLSLSKVVLPEVKAKGLGRADVYTLLNENDAVVAWRKQNSCIFGGGNVITGAMPAESPRINFSTTNETLSSNLDQIVLQLGTYFWIVDQTTVGKKCYATVEIPPLDPPRR